MNDVDTIEQRIRTMFDSFVGHDAGAVESALHQDCTVWDVFVPELIEGEAARLAYHQADQAQSQARGTLDLRVEMLRTDVWGDFALSRYIVRFDYQPPNPTSGVVRITTVLRRLEGKWVIVHHQEGMMPNGVPPLATA